MLWLILGILLGLGLAYLAVLSRSGNLRVRWYQGVLAVVAVGFLLLALQNYLALQDELEPKLATFSLIAFGLPGVIAGALVWLIPALRKARGASEGRTGMKTA